MARCLFWSLHIFRLSSSSALKSSQWPQVEVRLQDQIFRDEVDWDLADPQNTPYKYASAVCYELGLGWDAAAAVATAIETQLQLKSEVCTSMQPTWLFLICAAQWCIARLQVMKHSKSSWFPDHISHDHRYEERVGQNQTTGLRTARWRLMDRVSSHLRLCNDHDHQHRGECSCTMTHQRRN